jgi:hypothetical protein
VITQAKVPDVGSLSWIRSYHTGVFSDVPPAVLLEAAAESGGNLIPVDVNELDFFDIQALRRGHVARAKFQPVEVTGLVTLPGPTGDTQVRKMRALVITHVLAHRSGLVLLRPTIRFDSLSVQGGLAATALHRLERAMWTLASDLWWHVPGSAEPLAGYTRNYLNFVFLDLFARWSGDTVDPHRLAAWAVEDVHGCDRLHEMVAEGMLEHPFPVSFGTDIQLVLPRRPDESGADWSTRVSTLAMDVMRPESTVVDTPPCDLEPDTHALSWFVDEHVSLLVRAHGRLDDNLDVIDMDRTQVTEYLSLRRAGLANVQRATQRVITEHIGISRPQLARWQYLVATLTDDYVLHSRTGRLIEPLKLHFSRETRLRDVNDLERQVRSNLDWFQARIEAAAAWTGGLVGAVVGAGALALSLTEPARIVIARVTGTPAESVADRHGLLLAGTLLVVVSFSFVVSFSVVRRLSSSLRLSQAGATRLRAWRWSGQRGVAARRRSAVLASRHPGPRQG